MERPSWTSKYSFILATIGSAVGLGNIWRFPYIMGQYGGAVFLFVYLLLIVTICFIPMISELAFGKIAKKECISAFESVNPKFKFFGFLNPLTGILVASFYFIVGGWIINYILINLKNASVSDYSSYFSHYISEPYANCFFTLLFLGICLYFTARGVKKGIEFANNVLMPLFAVILIGLIIYVLQLDNSFAGLEYMFKPDFSKLSGEMFLAALGQALFTLSIGMGCLLTYGSYISEDKNIVKSTYTIIFSDTFFAIMAGIMIFPAIFSFGLQPNSGAGLVFITMPQIFSQMPHGTIVSAAFFVLLFCAAVTSGISILEVSIATLTERFNLSRLKSAILLFIIISLIAVPAVLSFGVLSDFKIIGKSIFDFLDFATSNILMPLNALVLCIIAGWFLKIKGKMFISNKIMAFLFDFGLKVAIPLLFVLLLYIGLK